MTRQKTESLAFLLILSLAALLLKLALFDGAAYFLMRTVPNHDLYQAAPFFATHMHSLRLYGELAWWNPAVNTGYAQYYQSFLSPLAPTCNHPLFMLWAGMIYVLSLFSTGIPEYIQFLIFNHLLSPFLSFLAFGWCCSKFLKTRRAMVLGVLVFSLSGIGAWISAWFYYQEWISFFFLVGAYISFLRSPGRNNLLVFATALLVQVASANYWTVYNSWAYAILLALSLIFFFPETKTAIRGIKTLFASSPKTSAFLLCLCLGSLLLSLMLNASVYFEQGDEYVRLNFLDGNKGRYSKEQAYFRGGELRAVTLDLFNPSPESIALGRPSANEMQTARYLGVFLLPLLFLFFLQRMKRKEHFLFACVFVFFLITFAPPPLLLLWNHFPFIGKIVHFFFFYSHFFQLSLLCCALVAFDRLLLDAREHKHRGILAFTALVAGLLLPFSSLASLPGVFPFLYAGVVVLFSSLSLLLVSSNFKPSVFTALFLLLATFDLSNWWHRIERMDEQFTSDRRYHSKPFQRPLTEEVRQRLMSPWAPLDPKLGFNGGLLPNLPVANDFWPANMYIVHREVFTAIQGPPVLKFFLKTHPEALFATLPYICFDSGKSAFERLARRLQEHTSFFIQLERKNRKEPEAYSALPLQPDFQYVEYNTFKLSVTCPADGWVVLKTAWDKNWNFLVNGQKVRSERANLLYTGIQLKAGPNQIEMRYIPFSRKIYPFTVSLLLFTLCGLMLFARGGRDE